MNKVSVEVNKIMQSPTTPVVQLTYTVDITSRFEGKGVLDGDADTIQLIELLEKFNKYKLGE